jgi:hypothetical protein
MDWVDLKDLLAMFLVSGVSPLQIVGGENVGHKGGVLYKFVVQRFACRRKFFSGQIVDKFFT